MPKIIPAEIKTDEKNALRSATFNDIYHTQDGAQNQAQEVFLKGNSLPERWQNQKDFSILELGFGFGVNFLVTLKTWDEDEDAPLKLNYIALEKHPVRIEDWENFHPLKKNPDFEFFLQNLKAQYPPFSFGFHSLSFKSKNGKICALTLILGDVERTLPQLEANIDALFLDGFAPSKNAAMWSQETLWHLRRLSFYGTTLATWSVAKSVRQHLENAEFSLKKEEGLGQKRERLTGFFKSQRVQRPFFTLSPNAPKRAVVAGGGLAGGFCARFLAEKGFEVIVLAPHGIGDGASGNWSGLLHPLPSVDDNPASQLSRQAFYFALNYLKNHPNLHRKCGIVHLSVTLEQAQTMQKIVQNGVFDETELLFLPPDSPKLKGLHHQHGALFYLNGAIARPFLLCEALFQHPNIRVLKESFSFLREKNALWETTENVPPAPIVVLAMGEAMRGFFPLNVARGQAHFVEKSEAKDFSLKHAIISQKGYIVPEMDFKMTFGASFVLHDDRSDISKEEEMSIFQNLSAHFPCLTVLPNTARAAVRCFSPKRLPIMGKLPHHPGVFCLTALGARGLLFAPLLADCLTKAITGDFVPLPTWAKKALSPERVLKL